MKSPQYLGWLALALLAAAMFLAPWVRYLEIDACLDAGGRWDYTAGKCAGPNAEHRELDNRNVRTWTLMFVPPVLAGGLCALGLRAAMRRVQKRLGRK